MYFRNESDNESAISLPVYFKSVKKWTYILQKKKQKLKGQKKKGKKKLPTARVEPRNIRDGRSTRFLGYCATITNFEVCRQINQL